MRLYLSSYRLGNHPEKLLELLGKGRRTALIFNAADIKPVSERVASVQNDLNELKALGLNPFEVDLRAFFEDPTGLREILSNADLIWVRGGNSFVLLRAMHYSGAGNIIKELLDQDAVVYGGFSAGIDLLVPNLHGVELVDDMHVTPAGYSPEVIWEGLGILPFALAPHYQSDHPESVEIDKVIDYMISHHMPFIALRDGEVLMINSGVQMVVS